MSYPEPSREQGPGAMTRSLSQLARTWWLTLPLTAIGVVAGVALSTLAPTSYTADVRLGVGGQTLSAQTVPGYVFASQQLAATYARYVDDASATSTRLTEELGVEATESVTEIVASPIPDSSVLIIEVHGTDREVALQVAQSLADALVAQVAGGAEQGEAEETLAEFQELSMEVATLEVQGQALRGTLGTLEAQFVELPSAPLEAQVTEVRAQLADLEAQRSVLSLRQEATGDQYVEQTQDDAASLSIVRPPEITTDDATTRGLAWGTLGGMAGAGIALFLGTAVQRRRNQAELFRNLR